MKITHITKEDAARHVCETHTKITGNRVQAVIYSHISLDEFVVMGKGEFMAAVQRENPRAYIGASTISAFQETQRWILSEEAKDAALEAAEADKEKAVAVANERAREDAFFLQAQADVEKAKVDAEMAKVRAAELERDPEFTPAQLRGFADMVELVGASTVRLSALAAIMDALGWKSAPAGKEGA